MTKYPPCSPALFFFLLLLGTALPLHAAPVLHIQEKVHTFSPVLEGEWISHRFPIYNTGDEELRILQASPG